MSEKLRRSMYPIASFVIENSSTEAKRLCLIPGHYNTDEVIFPTNGVATLVHANTDAIVAAGYQCDQVASDYNGEDVKAHNAHTIKISGASSRTRYVDLLNYIRMSGLRVQKIRITNLISDQSIFEQELEVTESCIGAKQGSDFIQISSYRNPANYDQSYIDIPLEENNLKLDATTLLFMDVPGLAKFKIEYTLC